MSSTFVHAPWTDEQIAALSRWQNSNRVHPFTCGKRDGHPMDPEGDWGVLVPTKDGWICRHCDYTQDWAHDFMFETMPEPSNLLNMFCWDRGDKT